MFQRNNRAWLFIQKWVSDHAFSFGRKTMVEFYFTLRIIALFAVLVIGAFISIAWIIGYLSDKRKKKKRR